MTSVGPHGFLPLPPPNVMGGGTFFVPNYLGGRLYLLPVIGGTVHDGGRDCYDGGSLNYPMLKMCEMAC